MNYLSSQSCANIYPPVQFDLYPPVQFDLYPPVQFDLYPPVQFDLYPPAQFDLYPTVKFETYPPYNFCPEERNESSVENSGSENSSLKFSAKNLKGDRLPTQDELVSKFRTLFIQNT